MYEVGLAHAVRLPEEVIIFRSDEDHLPFDTTNIRVNRTYSPDKNQDEAREHIVSAICSTLREIDLRRNFAVQQVADSLDFPSIMMLTKCQNETVQRPSTRTMGEALSAVSIASSIQRLLEIGLLAVEYRSLDLAEEQMNEHEHIFANFMPYRCTAFGNAVFREISSRLTKKTKLASPDQ